MWSTTRTELGCRSLKAFSLPFLGANFAAPPLAARDDVLGAHGQRREARLIPVRRGVCATGSLGVVQGRGEGTADSTDETDEKPRAGTTEAG